MLGLAPELIKRGINLDFYTYPESIQTLSQSPLLSKSSCNFYPIKWLEFPSSVKYINLLLGGGYEKLFQQLSEKIDRSNYDWVLVGGDRIAQAPILLKYLKTKKIYLAHELKREFYERTEWKTIQRVKQKLWKILTQKTKRVERESLRATNLIIANSLFSKTNFKRVIGTSYRVEVINPFINKLFLEGGHSNFTERKGYLSVGRFSYLKGFDLLIKAFSILRNKKEATLTIAGYRGTDKTKLVFLARKLDVNVRFFEQVTDNDLKNLYSKTKTFLYFPRNEPFGLSIIEALSMGCKAIAVNEGGFSEIVQGAKNCTLIPRDVNTIARFVEKDIENKEYQKDPAFLSLIKNKLSVKSYVDSLLSLIYA